MPVVVKTEGKLPPKASVLVDVEAGVEVKVRTRTDMTDDPRRAVRSYRVYDATGKEIDRGDQG